MNRQIIINNLLVSYNEAGESGDAAVLFLHGWCSSKEAWRGIVERLKDVKIKRLAMDLPGFGNSETPKQPWGVGDYAAAAAGFIKKLELKKVIVVGHSFGGRVGIKLAAQHPELVGKLVLADSAGFAAASAKKSFYGGVAKIAKPFFKPKFMQGLRKKIYASIGAEDYVATPELQQTYIKVVAEDLSDDLKNIKCPTLIISGENDADTPPEFGRRMQALVSGSELVIIKNAGHFSFIDQPSEFTGLLEKFIA